MRHIEVDPGDVRVVEMPTRTRRPRPEPTPAGAGGWLRRHRLAAACGLAVLEALLWAFDISKLALLALAVVAVVGHFVVAPRTRSYTLHQATWTLAFAQALVAIGTVLLLVVSTVLAILIFMLLVGLVLAGLAALLGDRR